MKLITEVNESVQYKEQIDEATGNKRLFIEGVFLQSEVPNRNGRIYKESLLEREIQRYNRDYVSNGRAFGELGHPNGPQINLDRVSHIIEDLTKRGTNWHGRARITDTPMGNIARGIIESGGKLGVSTRGMGSLKMNEQGINEVQDDFYLATAADIVADPSAPDAFVNGVMEGVEYIWENNILVAHKVEPLAAIAKKGIEEAVRNKELDTSKKLEIFEKFINNLASKI